MTSPHERSNAWRWLALLVASGVISAGLIAATACVRVEKVYVECDAGAIVVMPKPAHAQALVVVNLNRSAANLVDTYAGLVGSINAALASGGILVDELAVLPLYGGTLGKPELIYGNPAVTAKDVSSILNDAAASGLYDGPLPSVTAEQYNLATIAAHLDTATLPPEQTNGVSQPFFGPPKDLFLIITITAAARLCGLTDTACTLGGQAPDVVFSTVNSGAVTDWLKLPGGTYQNDHILQLFITTGEGVTTSAYHDQCRKEPGIPLTPIDSMLASPYTYYSDLVTSLGSKGLRVARLDLCEALGTNGPARLREAAAALASGGH